LTTCTQWRRGRGAVGAGATRGAGSGKVGVQHTDKLTRGEIGTAGIDATIRDFVGAGTYVEHETGRAGSIGLDVQKGWLGAGASGFYAKSGKVRHFTAGKGDGAVAPQRRIQQRSGRRARRHPRDGQAATPDGVWTTVASELCTFLAANGIAPVERMSELAISASMCSKPSGITT